MVGATVLEYVTGAVMERLFHMRYWDYSDKPLNVNGHICLPVSIAWGGFSLLLIYLLHPPVEDLVFWLPGAVTEKGYACAWRFFSPRTRPCRSRRPWTSRRCSPASAPPASACRLWKKSSSPPLDSWAWSWRAA